ncbi:UvrD-helicase domain-containing protein [Streptomyces alkaliterrae]|uniref:DNA 3'-5' helicase n=2 Tax=Streptomyces alkaliterrae TaxID=2213162 RepID=A0A7W3WWA6_9ACTN|nr:UvrD-helicase domain-containing protein [Streptomyces alkaliterrae]MBB1259699.1 ATP-dependent helicase [Streptomyces alkaliterrae]
MPSRPTRPAPARLTRPAELSELLGIPFTAEQLRCATAPLAPQVIVAGAGSGKTTVMAARVVWLVGTGQVAPEGVLGLTFTNKAAGELAERVRRALAETGVLDAAAGGNGGEGEDAPGEPAISTYHAFAGRLLKDHGLRLGVEPTARLLADATRFQLAAAVLRSAPGPFHALTKSVSSLVTEVLSLDSELSEHLVEPDRLRAHDQALLAELEGGGVRLTNEALRQVPRTARARLELLDLVQEYRTRKARRELLDFGDQIAVAARLARDVPEVGRQLRSEYQVVLLDEYQDTSVAQRVLLAGLFGHGGHPVTAVGDPCQAIYGWRGASVANLDDFPRHFRRDAAQADDGLAERHSLSENRRSGGRLLALANTLAAPLRERHEGVAALRPAPGAETDGRVRCALLPTHAEELEWLADSLAHLVRTGTAPGDIAVLCRTATDFPRIQSALTARDVPVEVVGLSGLLHLPEVADLVAMCEVLQDPTANAALVRLLSGPRWRIGPRDLAMLGRRARLLVPPPGGAEQDPARRLAAAVEGTDPTEVVSLADALDTFLESGGHQDDLPFSAAARVRFAHFAAELRDLRRSLADPLMDVLHRVLTVTGLEVELAASPQALAARRRETLGRFLDVAAGFASLDGETTLQAFLAFLRAAEQYDRGLDGSLPGGDNTVKVLTAHKSKGLEWDVVAVPGLVRGQFPSTRGQTSWLAGAGVLPHPLRGDAATLPELTGWTARDRKQYDTALADHQATEELRLGYVALTRPRSLLLASGHWWGPEQKKPRGPSDFLTAVRDHVEADPANGEVEHWAEPPAEGEQNPALAEPATEQTWPLPLDPAALERRRAAADAVLHRLRRHRPTARPEPGAEDNPARAGLPHQRERSPEPEAGPARQLTPEERRLVASWDRDLASLTQELRQARRKERDVPLPQSLTASQLMRLQADPERFAADLVRPMPHPPQPAAARRGTRFHAWIESRHEALPLPLLGPDELPGGNDSETGALPAEIADERDLAALKEAFSRTPYASRVPHRVEAPFQLMLAGRVIRGRIDAVYRDGDGFEIVDWKTGRRRTADPLQLAVYRLAWAEQHGLPLTAVRAAFVHVRTGEVIRPTDLPDRAGLERLLLTGSPEEPVTPPDRLGA